MKSLSYFDIATTIYPLRKKYFVLKKTLNFYSSTDYILPFYYFSKNMKQEYLL